MGLLGPEAGDASAGDSGAGIPRPWADEDSMGVRTPRSYQEVPRCFGSQSPGREELEEQKSAHWQMRPPRL